MELNPIPLGIKQIQKQLEKLISLLDNYYSEVKINYRGIRICLILN
ncbi:MAG: hypothetical protein KKB21_00275 [Nanoarchaeota archaeon]|nr:hypothetical protein [Nanoarchaeota archaeon]